MIPGVFLTTLVGPFQDQAICEEYRQQSKDAFEMLGMDDVVFQPCLERKPA